MYVYTIKCIDQLYYCCLELKVVVMLLRVKQNIGQVRLLESPTLG